MELTEEIKKEIIEILKPKEDKEAFTTEEIISVLKWNKTKVQSLLKELKRRGKLEVVKVYREDVDGEYSLRPAYIIHLD